MRQFSVVRQQQRTGRVGVEPADGDDAGRMLDEVDDRAPALRVARGGDDARGLVQEDVGETLFRERAAVEANLVRRRTNVFSCPTSPLTVTRPSLISSSALRREATPARASQALRRMAH